MIQIHPKKSFKQIRTQAPRRLILENFFFGRRGAKVLAGRLSTRPFSPPPNFLRCGRRSPLFESSLPSSSHLLNEGKKLQQS